MRSLAVSPPHFQTIRHEVTGVPRHAEDKIQLVAVDLQNTSRRDQSVGMHIMVSGTHRCLPTGHSTTRELADLHLGFGVDRDAERFRVRCGLKVDLPQVVEDGVGFANFF